MTDIILWLDLLVAPTLDMFFFFKFDRYRSFFSDHSSPLSIEFFSKGEEKPLEIEKKLSISKYLRDVE